MKPHAPPAWGETLQGAISAAAGDFDPGELAYLAVTSKVELPFRDRLAWRLHRHFLRTPEAAPGSEVVVSREWRRTDLAVLTGPDPVMLLEAKALYGFDVHSALTRAKYLTKLRGDAAKMNTVARTAARFLLALVTHVDGIVSPHLRAHVVKYAPGIAGAASRFTDHASLVKQADEAWVADLSEFSAPVSRHTLDGGEVWGLQVTVDAYLIGPLPAVDTSEVGEHEEDSADSVDQ